MLIILFFIIQFFENIYFFNLSIKGIGRATCVLLAKYGAKVIVADINLANAEETIKIILEFYPYKMA